MLVVEVVLLPGIGFDVKQLRGRRARADPAVFAIAVGASGERKGWGVREELRTGFASLETSRSLCRNADPLVLAQFST